MKKIISTTVTVMLYSLLIVMMLVVVVSKASGGEPSFMGYKVMSVLSGSMEPTFQTGSIIAIDPKEAEHIYDKGDIITFKKEEGILVTHRITAVNGKGDTVTYETKGDNNDAADTEPVRTENVVGEYTDFTIPYVGYFLSFANSNLGTLLLMLIPGILLLIYSGVTIWQAFSQIEEKRESEPNSM
ncbi:signal peptidase [Pontibacillus litoralis JSM 072002]|uniref:Signal peptidase I n=2 Tax=Pontibacillus TaxID=289201 RepID=A0A0A5HR69_9BACI|nr:signal peptidase [Pontibacillus litoralis JSM 072002]